MEHTREYPGEYPVVLSQILSELRSKHQTASHPELCRWLCSRFDLVHLAKLRSLLFHTASLDPSFPASLFRDRMCCSSPDPYSKKLQLAVDIASMFNIIQNGSPAKERLPIARAPFHKNHSSSKPVTDNSPHHFIPATDPNFLLKVNKDLKCRAASLDKLHPLPLYGPGTMGRSCEMQSTYFPMEADSEASTEQESLSQSGPQPEPLRSCVHKRNIFKEDFHNMSAFTPKVSSSECTEGGHQRELQKPVVFFNHSFELPCTNPYMEQGFNSPLEERQRAKHESLDDLQASTYFGPSTVSEAVSTCSTKPSRPPRPVKSFSLNTEYVPAPPSRPITNKRPPRNAAVMNGDRESTKVGSPAPTKKAQAPLPLTSGPEHMERKDEAPWFNSRTVSRGFQRGEPSSNVSTQTEKGSEPRRLKSFSRTDSEMISDDISDIFRFLDDMSVCDSLNMVQSCYNSNGSLSQLTPRSDADSSPERSTVRLAKSRLDSLFHSLDNSDDELKTNVHRLVLRIGEIEKKLESLSGVRSEITQLLSKLNQLDHKVHKPEHGKGTDPVPVLSGHSIGHTTGHSRTVVDWSSPQAVWSSTGESLGVKALKNSLMRRSSRSLNQEPAQDWSTAVYCTERPRISREVRQKDIWAVLSRIRPVWQRCVNNSQSISLSFKFLLRVNAFPKRKPLYLLCVLSLYQGTSALDPAHLEYWLEDVYTPGFDSLLRRKQADLRRARACKLAALIAAATCTLLLVIVVPIVTMRT
uniref:Membrane integral NOTCH2 associated receptor 1 n=1 Tax=Neogobius melanostomus TaxID=47308 RepID=A0A8C6SZ80_9GOBI